MCPTMDDSAFDKALIAAAFDLAGRTGWGSRAWPPPRREAGLPLARARARFPGRHSMLLRFGVLADQAALADTLAGGSSTRDRLFDMLMRRIDVLQAHRDGVIALLRTLPSDPPLALLLALATRRSMRWMLEAAGVPTRGLRGELRVARAGRRLALDRARLAHRRERRSLGHDGGPGSRAAARRAGGRLARRQSGPDRAVIGARRAGA